MNHSPLASVVLFHLGPVPISRTVATTWALMAVLAAGCRKATRRLEVRPGAFQAVLETMVGAIEDQLRAIFGRNPQPFTPMLGSLFIFLLAANLSGVLPGVKAPTAALETPAALTTVVFFSVHYYGVRVRGMRRYLGGYLRPNPLLLPLNVLSEFTRSFSLAMRLFGNIMSDELVLAIILALAGLLVPIPFMAFAILVGIVQAYIFSVLAAVYIGGGIGALEK